MPDLFRRRRLRMVWEVTKGGCTCYVAGTVHFARHSYRRPLTELVSRGEVVIFEGPLDAGSQERVARYGMEGPGEASLVRALDATTVKAVNRYFAQHAEQQTSVGVILGKNDNSAFLERYVNARPWMAFFQVWSAYLRTRGWHHSEDMEAWAIAGRMGRRVEYLESVEEQLAALDAVPFERFVRFMNEFDRWPQYTRRFTRHYDDGTLLTLLPLTSVFPTRCDAIIGRRDPVFFEGIKLAFESQSSVAFIGISHPPGVLGRLREAGFEVRQVAV